jgi:hypothetical protein
MAQIIMDFDEKGNVTLEGKDFPAKTCDKEMEPLEKGLGVVKNRRNKAEYFSTQTIKNKVTY